MGDKIDQMMQLKKKTKHCSRHHRATEKSDPHWRNGEWRNQRLDSGNDIAATNRKRMRPHLA